MSGKRAKILAQGHVEDLLFFAHHTRHPIRNQVIVLLSLKAGLRAAEIANLSWDMVVDPMGEIATTLELQDRVAKKGSGRVIPIHPELREALMQLRSKVAQELVAHEIVLVAHVTIVGVPLTAGDFSSIA
jgi:integrase/recombinase XerD